MPFILLFLIAAGQFLKQPAPSGRLQMRNPQRHNGRADAAPIEWGIRPGTVVVMATAVPAKNPN
jgi:hypothetical protein